MRLRELRHPAVSISHIVKIRVQHYACDAEDDNRSLCQCVQFAVPYTTSTPNYSSMSVAAGWLFCNFRHVHCESKNCTLFTCVSHPEARNSYIGWTSVRPSVCPSSPSVTRWYCIKTAEHIVMLSSLHDSPFILVLCVSRFSRNSNGTITPCGAAKQRWGIKMSQFSTNTHHRYIAISQKWLKIDGYIQRGVLQALNPLSTHVTFTAIVPGAYPGAYPGRSKCALDSLDVAKFLHPQIGGRQRHTGVTLVR